LALPLTLTLTVGVVDAHPTSGSGGTHHQSLMIDRRLIGGGRLDCHGRRRDE
jgi:hypothetical protein